MTLRRSSPRAAQAPHARPLAVAFDLGGVVCRFRPERRRAALARAAGLSEAAVQERLWDSGFDRECDEGRHDSAAMLAGINARLGCRLDALAARRCWALAFAPDPAVLRLVGEVRSQVPTLLLTDNGPLLRDALPDHLPQVAQAFDRLLFSCEFGRLKAQPELFREAARRLGHAEAALLLVDDSPAALASAASAGWQTVAFTGAAEAAVELRARLGLPAPD